MDALITALLIVALFALLAGGVWIGLALFGVAWIGMELFSSRPAGDASSFTTSTNNLPPAAYMGRMAVSWNKDSPRGFMGSVIICWWPTET